MKLLSSNSEICVSYKSLGPGLVKQRFWSSVGILLSAALSLAISDPSARADTLKGAYVPMLDNLCGSGAELSAGCEEIRARPELNAAKSPWRSIGRLNVSGWRRTNYCTGTLISARHVLTAAHCLYDAQAENWAPVTALTFVAGYQRGSAEAVSKIDTYVTGPNSCPRPKMACSGSLPYRTLDWAIITLSEDIGRTLGYLNLGLPSSAGEAPKADMVDIIGYARIRQHVLTRALDCNIQSWGGRTGLIRLDTCPTMKGDSGAPLLRFNKGKPEVIGLLSGVTTTASSKLISVAIPITEFMFVVDGLVPDR